MSQFLAAIDAFETEFLKFRSGSAEAFCEHYEQFHGAYNVEICKKTEDEQVARLATASIGGMHIAVARWNAGIRGTVLSDLEHFCLRLPLTGSADTINPLSGTLSSGPDELGIFRAQEGVNICSSPDNAALNLAIPESLLESRVRSYFGKDLAVPFSFSSSVALNSASGEAIKSMIAHLLVQLVHVPEMPGSPIITSALNELIVSTVLSIVPHNYRSLQPEKPSNATPRYVQRTEDYMRANAHNPITVSELAEVAGCSERALQTAFKAYRDKPPLTVLRDIRLEHVRQDLRQGKGSVIDIAFKWGFYNPGRLAGLYSEKFGENPSRTLRAHR